ncbi:MAG TPA: hypothetical protein VEZ90_12255 [Blastocatellia bacterium]|nr:hypothetical protein [Blastocatellia bacterium]
MPSKRPSPLRAQSESRHDAAASQTAGLESAKPVELTDEEADRMVTEALDCELDEPEPFVKILLFLNDLHDQGRGPELSYSLHRLMVAAYNNSVVRSGNFYEYLDAIRQGRNLVKRARARIARG